MAVTSARIAGVETTRRAEMAQPTPPMASKSYTIPALLAASVAVPYVAVTGPEWSRAWMKRLSSETNAAGSSTPTNPFLSNSASNSSWMASSTPSAFPASNLNAPPAPPPLEGVATQSLSDVLRFDVTKEWVYQRWPRKTTALSELDLYGVRVPLVTGTRLSDLAGSLTYFFDQAGRVQRLSFHGRTADTTEVVQIATQRFGLQRQASLVAGEQLFELRRGDDLISILRTRPAPILWTTAVHESFSVDLELQDPTAGRPLLTEQPPIPPAKPIPPEPAKSTASTDAKSAAAATASGEKPESLGWSAWFPRSRASKPQIRQLDDTNRSW